MSEVTMTTRRYDPAAELHAGIRRLGAWAADNPQLAGLHASLERALSCLPQLSGSGDQVPQARSCEGGPGRLSADHLETVGELRAFLSQLPMPDSAPLWSAEVIWEGGLVLPAGIRRHDVCAAVESRQFGLALPSGPRAEEGLLLW